MSFRNFFVRRLSREIERDCSLGKSWTDMWTHSLLSLALTVGPPPVRRIANSDHLYAYGTNKLRRETTINGVRAVDLICWPFVKGISTCDSGEPPTRR